MKNICPERNGIPKTPVQPIVLTERQLARLRAHMEEYEFCEMLDEARASEIF